MTASPTLLKRRFAKLGGPEGSTDRAAGKLNLRLGAGRPRGRSASPSKGRSMHQSLEGYLFVIFDVDLKMGVFARILCAGSAESCLLPTEATKKRRAPFA